MKIKRTAWNKGLKTPGVGGRKKGCIPWNKGMPRSEETKKRASKALKGKIPWNKGKKLPHLQEENSPHWIGDDVGYYGVHNWVRKHLGKPTTCENCGANGLSRLKIHWANKDHQYKRELKDWLRLCSSCHKKYDLENGLSNH